MLTGSAPVADNVRVVRALDATLRRKDFIKKETPAVPLEVIMRVIKNLPVTDDRLSVVATILYMYYGALRQSEVVPPSVKAFDPLRHLTRADVNVSHAAVKLTIKAAKNMQKFDQRSAVEMLRTQHPETCPVRATMAVLDLTPTTAPTQPMFVFKNGGRPIPASYIRSQWKLALAASAIPPALYTLHSLRKASASTAYNEGCNERQVQHFGKWASDAYKTYIYRDSDHAISRVLSKTLKPLP